MTFFPEPLKPSEDNKDNPIIVNPIGEDKKGRHNTANYRFIATEKQSSALITSFLCFIKKIILFLNPNTKASSQSFLTEEVINDSYIFYTLLEQLKTLDLSRTPSFCQQLSEIWNHLLQHRRLIHRMQKNSTFNLNPLNTLIKSINTFPTGEDQKLGYYLSEHAGKHWLPAPFMNLLYLLHDDYKVKKSQSQLEEWTRLLFSISPEAFKEKLANLSKDN